MRINRKTMVNILNFLFPEIQIYKLIQEKGFFAKKEASGTPSRPKQPVQPKQSDQRRQSNYGASTGNAFQGPYPAHAAGNSSLPSIPSPDNRFQTDGFLAQGRGETQPTFFPEEMDHRFYEAEISINAKVIGQELFVRDLVAAYKQGYMNGRKDQVRNVILIAGAAGTGKKTALEYLVKEMHKHKLASMPQMASIDLSSYEIDELSGNFIQDMAAAFQGPGGTVLFSGFKESDPALVNLVAQLAMEGSFRTKEGVRIRAADYYLIFYIDEYAAGESRFGQIPPAIANQIPAPILRSIQATAISSPLDEATMRLIAETLLRKKVDDLSRDTQTRCTIDSAVFEALASIATANKTFGEAVHDWMDKELIPVVSGLRARDEIRPDEKVNIKFTNGSFYVETRSIEIPIKAKSFVRQESIDDVLGELNALTGLESVKKFVHELMETVQVNKLRAREGANSVAMALHMVFTGNPGTGKTTVARLIGRILKALGLLTQGQLVEVSRQELVGQYVGSTAPKTMAKVTEALEGVLFIDEAYTLARHDHDTFGIEAIDTIVKAMEDNRSNLVVVIAGYTREMEVFLRSNPGLRSRFPFIVEFPDYQAKDMVEIMLRMAHSNGFSIEADAHEGLIELFENRQIPGRNDSGNGRLVRNLFEEAVRKQSTRIGELMSKEDTDLQLLTGADFGIGAKEAFNIENELAGIVGLDKVKTFVRTLEKQLVVDRRRKEAGVQVDTGQTLNMIFSGNPGTGKTTMARLLAGMLRSMEYLKKGHLVEVDRSDLVGQYVGETANKTKLVIESALGGLLFIDEAYALAQDGVQGGGFGKEAIDTLVRLIELHKDNLIVVLAGYTEDMQRFVGMNPGLSSRFPLQIEFPDYTAEDMQRIASLMVRTRGFTLAPDVTPLLRTYFNDKQIPGKKDGGNGRLVRNTLEEAIRKQAERLADHPDIGKDQLTELIAADFGLSVDPDSANHGAQTWELLDSIVGLATVKNFVRSLSAQVEVARRRQEMGLPISAAQTLHMVFKGNPGTGKTTIARILARRFKELGVIKADTLVETDRSGLVAGYVGQTALKTREVIERALGGILFVDEAYALAADGDHFGQEAIDTLVKAMDDYRDRLIVILAGYDEDMERFLDSNAGLRSRFPNIITFPDYSEEEMLQISHIQVAAQGYVITGEADSKLLSLFGTYRGNLTAGNGRLVRNLVEKAIRSHAMRMSGKADATAEELSTLIPEDFER
ncbi:AAA family ATPase [Paenibacillus eucommiae]|uniref:SpoVK/Ycf46/Vps4 family AAA+-type ATPase n=1 Tax=Paenibacillus eucommiae TaxID=1355755 RepID=A0ABS4IPZ2_9BACL|nr:AAA family ATPase [Paenibacillus eucommiae]MBP1989644.1 SpoVK/Ycf46/Vps4 family AAA+-type ATPase [Paenibacillus eucommiae]